MYNPHTGESLHTVYWADGDYICESLDDINHIFRDYRTGDIKSIDRNLLDLLHALERKIDRSCTFHIVSGYRSPRTNALLRRRNKGIARKSYHMFGQAVDIRIPRYSVWRLRKAAVRLKMGGVGYYRRSRFIHVDVGPVRYW